MMEYIPLTDTRQMANPTYEIEHFMIEVSQNDPELFDHLTDTIQTMRGQWKRKPIARFFFHNRDLFKVASAKIHKRNRFRRVMRHAFGLLNDCEIQVTFPS